MSRRAHEVSFVVLLALSLALGGVSVPETTAPGAPEPALAFEDVTAEVGLDYASVERSYGNGNDGVYVTDFDDDGWPDVLTTGGESPALFENDRGTFRRTDRLPDVEGTVRGALFFDRDGDGWEDLLLLTADDGGVFLENEAGTFERRDVGIDREFALPLGATAADYDGDGRTDLFVFQSGDWTNRRPAGYRLPKEEVGTDNGNPNLLFRNTGDGFERVTDAGIAGEHWSLAASFVDLTGDGRPDVHVANDFNHDVVYVNEGDGTFDRRRLAEPTDRNGMSSEVAVLDGSPPPSVLVTNIYLPVYESNTSREKYQVLSMSSFVVQSNRTRGNNLLRYDGNGTFVDRARARNVRKGGWGWAAAFADLDNDGDQDLFHSTQRLVQVRDTPHFTYPMLWRRTGERFEKQNASATGFAETDGRGVADLDFDRDGDVDLIVGVYGGEFRVYENRGATGNSLEIRLAGGGEVSPLGATVRVTAGGQRQVRLRNAGADYQSQGSRVLHFGLGDAERVDSVEVRWRDGSTQTLEDVRANRLLTVSPAGVVDRQPLPVNGTR